MLDGECVRSVGVDGAPAPHAGTFAERLRDLDLRPVRDRLAARPGWSDDRLDRAERLYRVFLGLRHRDRAVPPPTDVDAMWHEHILMTRRYHDDCIRLFGAYLHHDPAGEADPRARDAAMRLFREAGHALDPAEPFGDCT